MLHLPQALVSKHLAYLRKRGLVEATRHGQWMIYALPQHPPPELTRQLRCLERCVPSQPRFARDLRRLQVLQPQHRWLKETLSEFATLSRPRAVVSM